MSLTRTVALLTTALLVATVAGAASARLPWKGYLTPEAVDTIVVLPAPPAAGSAEAEADRAVFRATRALEGTPRWTLAVADLPERNILKNLSCAIGADLKPLAMPKLTGLLFRMGADVSRAVSRPKALYQRPRPYLVDDGAICATKNDRLAASPDYPSGHATWSWSVGLVMAELVPERSSAILTRARAFGESRIVCGVHNASSVAAGRMNAAAVVAALHGSPAFRDDLAGARREVARALEHPRAPKGCDAEAEALAVTL
ncbi:MAG: phosphatase PAP2 family protein [Caulobacter sp.]|nr:phosphatase PAP2 family protein [Caulobacter sp.]